MTPRTDVPSPPDTESAAIEKPFLVRAAEFAFWAPIVACAIISIVKITGIERRPSTTGGRELVSILLMLTFAASVILAIVALIGKKRLSTLNIAQGIAGLSTSALVLMYLVFFPMFTAPLPLGLRIVGNWRGALIVVQGQRLEVRMTLRPDRTVTISSVSTGNAWSVDGRLFFSLAAPGQTPETLTLRFTPPFNPELGESIVWSIDRVDDNRLQLRRKSAGRAIEAETFERADR